MVLIEAFISEGRAVLRLMIYILHYLKDPKLWELWHSLKWAVQDIYIYIYIINRLMIPILHDPEYRISIIPIV